MLHRSNKISAKDTLRRLKKTATSEMTRNQVCNTHVRQNDFGKKIKEKDGHYIMIKEYKERYIPLKYIHPIWSSQIHLTNIKKKKGIDENITIVMRFNTPLTSMDKSLKQKINKAIETLKDTNKIVRLN